jgi:hypothetical protein
VPCCLLILVLLFPRVALAVLFLFTRYLAGPFHHNLLLLVVGFIFLPLTTLVYAWMFHQGMPMEGISLLWLLLAALIDLGMIGGGYRHHQSRR